MMSVMKVVQEGTMGATIKHGLPKNMLKNRLSDKVTHGIKSGPK